MGEHDATEAEPREDIERSLQVRVSSSSSSDTLSTHIWVLYIGLFLELSFSKSGECHDRLHIYRLCGIFYFPWHRHQTEGTDGF